MTKMCLVAAIQSSTKMTENDAFNVREGLPEIMKSTLGGGEEIKIANFGKFEVKRKKERRGRNPQTGENLVIDSRQVLTFKPSALFKNRINE
jgi:integration host factor subunit alpha